jgi:predicted PurR-regulated permease PerM
MSISSTPPKWSRDTKVIVTVIALLIAAALVYIARSVVPLLVLAAVLAYIFQPLVGWLERHRVGRGLAAILCILLLVLLVALGPVLLVPAIVDGVRTIVDVLARLPELLQQARDMIVESALLLRVFGRTIDISEVILDYESQVQQAVSELSMPAMTELVNYLLEGIRTAGGLFRTAADIASGVITIVLSALLLLVYTFYLTKDGNRMRTSVDQWVLSSYRTETVELVRRLDTVWKSFFRGQIVLSLTIGILTTAALSVLGVESALVLGILAGVLEVVPNLGPILAMIPAVLVALIEGSTYLPIDNHLIFASIVLLVYVLIQQIENNVLVPRIMGMSLNLHPLLVLIGVVVGAGFAGILGAFLAAPVLASLKVVGIYAYAKVTDQEPFPAPAPLLPVVKEPGKLKRALARLRAKVQPAPATVAAADPAGDAAQLAAPLPGDGETSPGSGEGS